MYSIAAIAFMVSKTSIILWPSSRITIESISREKVILILKTFQDMNYTYYNDLKNYNEAKKYLKNLRNHTINFYLLIIFI